MGFINIPVEDTFYKWDLLSQLNSKAIEKTVPLGLLSIEQGLAFIEKVD